MSRIVFVDPQDPNEKYWWPALIVNPSEYDAFYQEMGEQIPSEGDHLVCYFEDASYSMVMNGDIKELEEYMVANGIENIEEYVKREAKDKSDVKTNESYDTMNEKHSKEKVKEDGEGMGNKNGSKDSMDSICELSAGFKKWLISRSVRSALRLKFEGRVPLKFKWMKKRNRRTRKKETDVEGGFKKKIWKEAAAQIYKDFDYSL